MNNMSYDKLTNYYTPSMYRPLEDLRAGQSYFSSSVVKLLEVGKRMTDGLIADSKDVNFSELRANASEAYAKELGNISEASEMDGKVRTAAAVFFAAVFGEAMFETGKSIADTQQAQRDMAAFAAFKQKDFKEIQAEIDEQNVWPESHVHFAEIKKVVEFKSSVFGEVQTKNYWKLALKIGIIAGAVLGLLGALIGLGVLLVIGAGVVGLAIGGWFLNRGIAARNSDLQTKALETKAICEKLLALKVRIESSKEVDEYNLKSLTIKFPESEIT